MSNLKPDTHNLATPETNVPPTAEAQVSEPHAFSNDIPMWEPQPDEPLKYYEWFHAYLMMGPSRSVYAAFNLIHDQKKPKKAKEVKTKPTQKPTQSATWVKVSRNWHWHARAVAFDEQKRKEAEAEYDASIKAAREKLRQRALNARQGLMDKIEEMLTFPIGEVEQETDGKTTIIKPGKWSFDTTARLLMAQMKLDELDAPMGNAEVSVTVKSGEGKSVTVTVTPEDMSDEALAQIAAAGASQQEQ